MSTAKKSPKSSDGDWHKKIAKSRGETWRKNMLAGRREASLNPSLIRLTRLFKNIHQSVIAKKLNISESTFGAIERGKQLVQTDTAKEISTFLGAPVTKLFKSAGKKKMIAVIQKRAL